MSGKLLDRLVAAGGFAYALVLYVLTMAETSPFWDSGEFIAISHGLQVSHPPGAPLYMIVGRFFSFFAPLFSGLSPEPVAYAVNLVSVLSSAATVLARLPGGAPARRLTLLRYADMALGNFVGLDDTYAFARDCV